MSFRKQMKDIKKEMLAVKHPLFFEDESLKFSYAIGIALIMMQSDDGHILTLSEHNALNELVLGLDLPEGRLEKVISKAQKTDAKILKEIICKLMKSDYRYLFVLDLLKVANLDKEITLGKREFIDDIMQMMQLSSVETDFLCGFSDAIKTNDQKVANDTVYLALEHSLAPNIEHLQFFLPKFIYEEVIPGFELNSEEFHVLKRSGRVSGKIVIGYGAKLSIKGIELIFSGDAQIVINGGILELEGSTLKATEKSENALIGKFVVLVGSTGIGQMRKITDNDGTTLTVSPAWYINPDGTTSYKICDKFYRAFSSQVYGAVGSLLVITDTSTPA